MGTIDPGLAVEPDDRRLEPGGIGGGKGQEAGEGARQRDELAALITELEETCDKFDEAKARKLERDAKLAEKRAAKSVLAGAAS